MGLVKKTVNITDQQENWLRLQIADGQYGNDSELIRDLIRKEQRREEDREHLRAALIEGQESGLSEKTFDEIVEDAIARRQQRGDS